MADVEAWRRGGALGGSQTQSKGTRAACPSRPSAHPYLTFQQQPSNGRGPGVWDCESQEVSSAPQRGDAQPVATAVLWRAAPAEGEFRFVILPVQPEMDLGISVQPEMAGVGGRIICVW